MSVSVVFESKAGINPVKAGWVLGTALGLWHLTWSALVALGWAQAVIDFVFWMHFLKPIYVLQPFDPAIAFVLVLATSTLGFFIGAVFALLWNWLHK
jgi:hypothetical protein